MATNVLRDLKQMRSMFDSPSGKYSSPARSKFGASAPGQHGYSYALHTAEKSVDRLGHAIEEAEAEMEAALRRTTDVHKMQLRQKELEVSEMQRVMAAKDRSIESVRDTLATTQRSYEGRLAQAEALTALRDNEIRTLQEDLRTLRLERDNFEVHLHREAASASASAARVREAEAALREQETQAALLIKQREAEVAALHSALSHERRAREKAQAEAEELRAQVDLLTAERQRTHAETSSHKELLKAEVEELRHKLRTEKHLRKACETWLRSELKSREEMDALLAAIKDSASAGDEGSREDVLARLQATLGRESAATANGGGNSSSSTGDRRYSRSPHGKNGAHSNGYTEESHFGSGTALLESLLAGGTGNGGGRASGKGGNGQRESVQAGGGGRGGGGTSGGGTPASSREVQQHQRHQRQVMEVQDLLSTLRHTSPTRDTAQRSLSFGGSLSRQLEGDNDRLKADLAAAQRLLADRLWRG